jgi:seryl-tRNA synthetase
MLDIKWIRENSDALDNALAARGSSIKSSQLLELDKRRREVITEVQDLQAKRKTISKEIGVLKSKGEDTSSLMEEMQSFGPKVKALEEEEKQSIIDFENILVGIPNVPEADVPVGKDEDDNVEIRKWGEPRKFDFEPKAHYDLGEQLGLDFAMGAKLTGARYAWLQGDIARLERAIATFMLDHLREKGFTEIIPPFIVNDATMTGTGQLPKFAEDLFKVDEDRWLIPTAEVPLTNFVRDEIVDPKKLPLKFCAWTPCFRSEAGSAGKDTRGYIRMHQFFKVEMVQIVHPEKSSDALEEMTLCAEEILQKLDIAYRTIILCTGDIGFSAKKTYDIEVWVPAQNTYREISSCSNCGDFQARRMKARFKNDEGKTEFLHTLNGSCLATGRTLVAVMENYQNADGSLTIPDALQPYMGGQKTIEQAK